MIGRCSTAAAQLHRWRRQQQAAQRAQQQGQQQAAQRAQQQGQQQAAQRAQQQGQQAGGRLAGTSGSLPHTSSCSPAGLSSLQGWCTTLVWAAAAGGGSQQKQMWMPLGGRAAAAATPRRRRHHWAGLLLQQVHPACRSTLSSTMHSVVRSGKAAASLGCMPGSAGSATRPAGTGGGGTAAAQSIAAAAAAAAAAAGIAAAGAAGGIRLSAPAAGAAAAVGTAAAAGRSGDATSALPSTLLGRRMAATAGQWNEVPGHAANEPTNTLSDYLPSSKSCTTTLPCTFQPTVQPICFSLCQSL